ncbi:hypothetical protein AB3M99_02310 [Paenibacillus taichungensis]
MSIILQLPNGTIINRFNIVGTQIIVYEAFEISSYTGNHANIQHFNEHVYGKISSRRNGSRSENINESIQYILDAFPYLKKLDYRLDNILGRIETVNE